jgi:hypothetical protein
LLIKKFILVWRKKVINQWNGVFSVGNILSKNRKDVKINYHIHALTKNDENIQN